MSLGALTITPFHHSSVPVSMATKKKPVYWVVTGLESCEAWFRYYFSKHCDLRHVVKFQLREINIGSYGNMNSSGPVKVLIGLTTNTLALDAFKIGFGAAHEYIAMVVIKWRCITILGFGGGVRWLVYSRSNFSLGAYIN
jgi:hypothetical protein